MRSTNEKRPREFHAGCFACGPGRTDGIGLVVKQKGKEVTGDVVIDDRFQGYDGIVHGGIIASLLDAAMVQCLQSKFGKDPFTCKLETRYYHETHTGQQLVVKARFTSRRGLMCWAEGEVFEGHGRCADARGIFKLT